MPPARVLIVDDERFFREAIEEILTGGGFDCIAEADGEAALERIADPELGVLVLDIALPGIDGIEVLRRTRERRPDLRVLMLSASTDQEQVLEALRLGACDYLAKPLHDEELVLAVRRAAESFGLRSGFRRLRRRLGWLVQEVQQLTVGNEASDGQPFPRLRWLAQQGDELLNGDGDSDPSDAPDVCADPDATQEIAPRLASAEPGDETAERDFDAELARVVCEAMVSEAEPERVLTAALRPLAAELGAVPISIYLQDANSGELLLEEEWDGGLRSDHPSLPADRGLTGAVLQSGHLVATAEPGRDPRFDASVDAPLDGRAGPLLCVPLRIRGRAVGVARAFLEDGAQASAQTGEVLAAALSAAVRNMLLYRSLVESIEEVAAVRCQVQGAAAAPPPGSVA